MCGIQRDDTAIIAKTQEKLQDMENRLVDTRSKYEMETNIDKSQIKRGSRRNISLWIKVGNSELKKVDHFKFLEGVLARVDYPTSEINMRITVVKEAFNRKLSLLTRKLNIQLRMKIVWYI